MSMMHIAYEIDRLAVEAKRGTEHEHHDGWKWPHDPECRALYDGWLRWLTDQGPVTGWRNYPPPNGNERRIKRDLDCRDRRIQERIALVKTQLALVVRVCLTNHQPIAESLGVA